MQVPERNYQGIIGFKNLDMLPFCGGKRKYGLSVFLQVRINNVMMILGT